MPAERAGWRCSLVGKGSRINTFGRIHTPECIHTSFHPHLTASPYLAAFPVPRQISAKAANITAAVSVASCWEGAPGPVPATPVEVPTRFNTRPLTLKERGRGEGQTEWVSNLLTN